MVTVKACVLALFGLMSGFSALPLQQYTRDQKIIEGDILVTAPLKKLMSEKPHRTRREITTRLINRWSNNVVPYMIDSQLGKFARRAIRHAIREFHQHTCVQFVRRTNEKDYIYFERDYGCYSPIGRQGGRQKVAVGEACEHKGTIMHELMHTLGFFHEQSRSDRDKYVKILWWNIEPDFMKNFESYSHEDLDTLNVPYDYDSLMHYEKLAFSKNRQNTIEALDDANRQLGQMDRFSRADIEQVLKAYKCRSIDKDPLPAQPRRTNKEEAYVERVSDGKKEINGNCKDLYPVKCKQFASHRGYCKYWKPFMEKICPVACGFCKSVNKHIRIWDSERRSD